MNDNLTPPTNPTPDTTSPAAMFQSVAFGYARHAITFLAAWLLHKGIIDQDGSAVLVSLLMGLASLAWSTGYKFATRTAHNLALQAAASGRPADAPTVAAPAIKTPGTAIIAVLLLPALFLQGCVTSSGTPTAVGLFFQSPGVQAFNNSIANFLTSPANQAIVNFGISEGSAVLVNSLGSKVPPAAEQPLQTAATAAGSAVAWGVINGVATAIRTQQATPTASSAPAIVTAIQTNTANAVTPAAANAIATSVSNLTAQGVPPDVANEAVASTLDAVAAAQATPAIANTK